MIQSFMPYYFLRRMDIFGTQISLNYNKDSQYRTFFGGSVAAICIALIALLCFSTVKTLFEKSQVSFIQSTTYSVQPDNIIFDNTNYMIAVQYDQPNFVKRPYYNITFEQRYYKRLMNGTTIKTKTPIPLEPCTIDHFINLPSYGQNWTYTFQLEDLQNFLCLKKGTKFQIGGIFENEDFYFVKFAVTKCVNSTANPLNPWNPVCESPSVVKANQNEGSRIRFYLSNNFLNPERAENSITSYLDSILFNVQQGLMYTTANVYLNSQTLITDESILPLPDTNQIDLMQYKLSETWQQNAVGNFDIFCEIYFRRSYYTTVIHKSYLKLVQVISYIGGFSQVFILISAFLVRKYNGYIFAIELANKLYDFDIPDDPNQKNHRKSDVKRNSIYNNQKSLTDQYAIRKQTNQNLQEYQERKNDQTLSSMPNKIETKQTLNNIQGMSKQQTTKNFSSMQFYSTIKPSQFNQPSQLNQPSSLNQPSQLNQPIQDDVQQFIPLDQIRQVLMDKGLGQQYYKTDYFAENNNQLTTNNKQIKENNPTHNITTQNDQNQIQIQEFKKYAINNNDSDQIMQTKDNKNLQEKEDISQLVRQDNEFNLDNLNKHNQEENDNQRKYKSQTGFEQKNFSGYLKSLTKADSYFEKKQSDILQTQRSVMKFNQSSRKSLFQYTENTPQAQGAKPFSSFGASSRNITKIIQQKYGGAAEQFLEKEFKIIIQREKKIWLNFKYIINQLTCGKFFNSPNVKLIEKAKNLVRDDLDIFNILDRQKELEKMKKLFFSEDQQVLFNFFPKPIISINNDNTTLSLKSIKQEQMDLQRSITKVEKKKRKLNISFKYLATIAKAITKFKKGKKGVTSNYQKLFNHYLKLSQENDVNNSQQALNKKLIDLLGDEMRSIFEVAKRMQQRPREYSMTPQNQLQSDIFMKNLRSQKTENQFNTDQNQNMQESNQIIENNQKQIKPKSIHSGIFEDLMKQNTIQNYQNENITQKIIDPSSIVIQFEENNSDEKIQDSKDKEQNQ
ncbi:transmembrane protein, putative (macronuclear) [Tetrahymena thermophila SB210]|uniref:Transmembrane protein, putative n=1 Tax=Tetrahymena thermophila (strain SB210) TaxID=312017 RepID=Q22SH4_TETTS|nr:transmembrane protein, putative [Tetrahymena thermophila SB210]EAR87798.2 transmembrane protein, putative [Tetrahymena thermophila SB210]|eukprot:XP_001008043.2 transmembrane protein, putative [Tetrahymena thermophila SB210]